MEVQQSTHKLSLNIIEFWDEPWRHKEIGNFVNMRLGFLGKLRVDSWANSVAGWTKLRCNLQTRPVGTRQGEL